MDGKSVKEEQSQKAEDGEGREGTRGAEKIGLQEEERLYALVKHHVIPSTLNISKKPLKIRLLHERGCLNCYTTNVNLLLI